MVQNISIVRGTSNSFGIDLTDKDGKPYTLEEGQVLVFALKRKPKDEERLMVKKIIATASGEYCLEFVPADTADMECGRYYYDIGMQHGAYMFHNVIKASVFDIAPNITELGDGS